jgi:hypothetical protein
VPKELRFALVMLIGALSINASPPAAEQPPATERHGASPTATAYTYADTDPDNDGVVGPPDSDPECLAELEARGISFKEAKLPIRKAPGRSDFMCGTEQAVVYLKALTSARISPRPVVSCRMALALARFEEVAQEEAERRFKSKIVTIRQAGTYNCRKMSRYDFVSEHSYGNAIDIDSFTLMNGKTISVARHFKVNAEGFEPGEAVASPGSGPTVRPEALFLRDVAHRLYDEKVFSVVLTAHFDALHKTHFHLDLARYRVDGTRP